MHVASSDAVVAVFGRDQLSAGLVAIHRAGFGPSARVLDPRRGDLDLQLRRAGHGIPVSVADVGSDSVLLLVVAPGRAERVIDLVNRTGARAVYRATRAGEAGAEMLPQAEQPPVAIGEPEMPPATSLDG